MKTMTPKQRAANQANGAKGGRPKGSLPKEEIAARKAVRSVMREEYLKAEKRIVARTIHLAENAFSEGVSLNACHDILDRLHGRPVQPQAVGGEIQLVCTGVPRHEDFAKTIDMTIDEPTVETEDTVASKGPGTNKAELCSTATNQSLVTPKYVGSPRRNRYK